MPFRLLRPLLVALSLSTALMPVYLPLAQEVQAGEKPPATVVADRIAVTGENVLTAEGNVEVFFDNRHLRAAKIVYDENTDRLQITGPLRFTEGQTDTIILASQADLAADLTEGILQSARIILNEKLQASATEMRREGGRYTDMRKAVASSCTVCKTGATPLWEIRAQRVLHDQQQQQIYFQHAQLRVAGVPVLYTPRLRMPDPTLDRATGFLTPTLVNSTALGYGMRIPYFIVLDPSRDLTITPMVTDEARSVDLRYRQAFRSGDILLQGALSRDRLLPDKDRGYVLAKGTFRLPQDFILNFTGQAVSDPGYFADYNLPDQDRLSWSVSVERTRHDETFEGRVATFQTLRERENNLTQPSVLTSLAYERRFAMPVLGGEGGVALENFAFGRVSSVETDQNGDGVPDGRDMSRLSTVLDWRRDWTTPAGFVLAMMAELRADFYGIRDDAQWQGNLSRSSGTFGAELSYPLVKREQAGTGTQILEPVIQFLHSPSNVTAVPNEDSTTAEFDEGNLFSFSRFPGVDRLEEGNRVNAGLRWARDSGEGWAMGAVVGRVYRTAGLLGVNTGSGQDTSQSDWLGAVRLTVPYGLSTTARALLNEDGTLTRQETMLAISRPQYTLSSTYLWAAPDVSEGRLDDTSELLIGGGYYLTPQWRVTGNQRYDLQTDRVLRTDLGLTFLNECVLFDVSLSRRRGASTNVKGVTTVDLKLDFLGFGGGGAAGPARVCRR